MYLQFNMETTQYMYIVRKYQTYLYEKQVEKRALGKFFRCISQRVQINFIFTDNICILCLSCNVEKFKTNVKFD